MNLNDKQIYSKVRYILRKKFPHLPITKVKNFDLYRVRGVSVFSARQCDSLALEIAAKIGWCVKVDFFSCSSKVVVRF